MFARMVWWSQALLGTNTQTARWGKFAVNGRHCETLLCSGSAMIQLGVKNLPMSINQPKQYLKNLAPCSQMHLFLAIFSGGTSLLSCFLVSEVSKLQKTHTSATTSPWLAKALVWMTTFGRYNMSRRPLVFRKMASYLQDSIGRNRPTVGWAWLEKIWWRVFLKQFAVFLV